MTKNILKIFLFSSNLLNNHILRQRKLIKIRKNKNRNKISNLGKTMYLIQFSSSLPINIKRYISKLDITFAIATSKSVRNLK